MPRFSRSLGTVLAAVAALVFPGCCPEVYLCDNSVSVSVKDSDGASLPAFEGQVRFLDKDGKPGTEASFRCGDGSEGDADRQVECTAQGLKLMLEHGGAVETLELEIQSINAELAFAGSLAPTYEDVVRGEGVCTQDCRKAAPIEVVLR